MNSRENFQSPSKIEPTPNKVSETKTEFNEYPKTTYNPDKEKEISDVLEEIKKYNSTAEIISVKSTPRNEINEGNKAFMESVFTKSNNLNEESKEEVKLEEIQEEETYESSNNIIENQQKNTKGLKNLLKKLFS